MSRAEVEADITATVGLVPSFFNEIPDDMIGAEWDIFKRMTFGETAIPNKYKELIGVAVHSVTHCRYCTLFHQEAAKLFGATDAEMQEAVHYAKYTVSWSVYLNGMRQDYDEFASELGEIGAFLSS